MPLNLIGSLHVPALSWETDAEALRDEIEGTVSSLLGLVGITADPLASREHVLLANLVEHSWRAGRDLDLGTLIGDVQRPPLRKLGVFELDAFFPAKDREALALRLNGLAASPSFAAWSEGAPLDPALLLGTADKPRTAIVYLAHLSDEERQFVVTLVLSKVVTWMRGLPGTTDLRALVYMDEVFGYVPPTAAPPSKKPILTLLKQGRAFGVGTVLATQNPVDLDYKAMSNAGTWLVGRLQTERDKARVLEGLRSAAGDTDVDTLDGRRRAREAAVPARQRTRAGAGALLHALGDVVPARAADEGADRDADGGRAAAGAGRRAGGRRDRRGRCERRRARGRRRRPGALCRSRGALAPGGRRSAEAARLQAFLAARVSVRFDDTKSDVDVTEEWEALYGPLDETLELESETRVDIDDRDFGAEPADGTSYVLPAAPIGEERFFREAKRSIERRLADVSTLEILRNPALRLYSRPGETEEAVPRPRRPGSPGEGRRGDSARSATASRRSRTGSRRPSRRLGAGPRSWRASSARA